MHESVVVNNIMLVLHVYLVGVSEVDQNEIVQVDQFELLHSSCGVGQALHVVNRSSDFVSLKIVFSGHVIVEGLLVMKINIVCVVKVFDVLLVMDGGS